VPFLADLFQSGKTAKTRRRKCLAIPPKTAMKINFIKQEALQIIFFIWDRILQLTCFTGKFSIITNEALTWER
jgi:hypothetical protein